MKRPLITTSLILATATIIGFAQDKPAASTTSNTAATVRAFIDDEAPGWRSLTAADFTKVNGADDTWSWKDGVLHCTGQPVSVQRTTKEFGNFELVAEWMHEKAAGNSGVFVWTTPASIEKLTAAGKPGLPDGIEVQILDHGFTDMMKAKGAKTDWFGTNGDVFPVRDRLIRTIGETSAAHLFVATILPQKAPRAGWEKVDAYNASLRAIVAAQKTVGKRITLVDMHAAITTDDLLPDGVHPNQAGMDKMAAAWFSALASSQ